MPFNVRIHAVQQRNMAIELIPNLDTQLMLAPNRLTQPIEMIILFPHNIRVVRMDLLIRHLRLINTRRRWLIPVRAEKTRAIPLLLFVNLILHGGCSGGVVHEPDGLRWRMLWNGLFEIRRGAFAASGGRRLRRALLAVELLGEVAVLLEERGQLVFQRGGAGAIVGVGEAGLLGFYRLDALVEGLERAGDLAILGVWFEVEGYGALAL